MSFNKVLFDLVHSSRFKQGEELKEGLTSQKFGLVFMDKLSLFNFRVVFTIFVLLFFLVRDLHHDIF